MKIIKRVLNKGETFCCSFKRAKEIFKNTEVTLNFAWAGRIYSTFGYTPDAYYMIHNIKGRVLACMYITENKTNPFLSFFVIRPKDGYTDDLRREFEEKYILEFYRFYLEMTNIKQATGKTKLMLVELLDGQLKLHKVKL